MTIDLLRVFLPRELLTGRLVECSWRSSLFWALTTLAARQFKIAQTILPPCSPMCGAVTLSAKPLALEANDSCDHRANASRAFAACGKRRKSAMRMPAAPSHDELEATPGLARLRLGSDGREAAAIAIGWVASPISPPYPTAGSTCPSPPHRVVRLDRTASDTPCCAIFA